MRVGEQAGPLGLGWTRRGTNGEINFSSRLTLLAVEEVEEVAEVAQ